ncbi:hypothetical protein BJ508DRAFT_362601 [Ascobolus immersus RN42]|uniref:DNA replication complex GINS protein PSF3 n=1 Tax=Ascobolus immersus RN42 TaxID=1160509 RepID=A0A3N4I2T6_ASCIM|nr:hypothetical protein BJ508DRAFT_362601 [Ascobolus immersus RN42]
MAYNNYYDVDEILASSQKIPCKFRVDIQNLGYLESDTSQNIKANTTILIPFWLAPWLCQIGRYLPDWPDGPVETALPACLNTQVLAALKASPTSLNLRDLAPYWYALGSECLAIMDDDELPEVLALTYKERVGKLADFVRGRRAAGAGEGEEMLLGLEEWERRIRGVVEAGRAVSEWLGERSNT